MKDHLLELVSRQNSKNAKFNIMREYLQAYVLRILHAQGFFHSHAFVGGTALRFLYDLPRFSEDLDFSSTNSRQSTAAHSEKLVKAVRQELNLAGYSVQATHKAGKTVQSAFIKFEKILFEARLSPLAQQIFSIKLEIDTNPPAGAKTETKIINKYFLISFLSYDISSLFAGKCHALLNRKYTKGRDFFDLGWYLLTFKGIQPNFMFLANALRQTGFNGDIPDETNWREHLVTVIKKADWKKVQQDLEPFVEHEATRDIFDQGNLIKFLERS